MTAAEPVILAAGVCQSFGKKVAVRDLGLRVTLAGDHMRVLVPTGAGDGTIRAALEADGLAVESTSRVEPTLEDVFLALGR